ncbi:PolC-type DNA polymerase III [Halobacillus sp. Marseille-Q1614]|uniref:3'-5' exonuclease n=1 Tax=Halobacillus sp. Marseille-Q1614 TaxID=2709134 RepID=UPI00156FDCF3|nr:exonuclease domain-containing protein [Halobacillus sp. Marseille-Q1614]
MLPIDLQILKYFFFEKPIYAYKIRPYLTTGNYLDLREKLSQEVHGTPGNQPLTNITYTVFDLETTGFLPEIGHEIISIGAVRMEGLDTYHHETFHQVVKPIRPVRNHTLKLTGLSREQIDKAPSFLEAFDRFLEFSRGSVLVAYPAKFDMRFMKAMLKRWKLPDYSPPVIDSQLMAKWLFPERKHYQLDPLLRKFSIPKLERHHALNDSIMTAELFRELLTTIMKKNILTFNELNDTLSNIEQKK